MRVDVGKTQSIIDYARTEFRTFDQLPLSAVDSLILSQLSYLHFDGAVGGVDGEKPTVYLSGLYHAELFDGMLQGVRDVPDNTALFCAVCASPRFRDLQLNYFVSRTNSTEQKQFSAVTFLFADGSAYIAFRGTDATVIGWKEDFNMSFLCPVPSQQAAADYLVQVAGKTNGHLRLGGHSKGGNLAIYSAAYAPELIQRRIDAIYNHDGPGFPDSVRQQGRFNRITPWIQTTLPRSSIIGMLFDNVGSYRVVQSTRMGLMQHDPFSWEIDGADFAYTERITDGARFMDQTLNGWMGSLSSAQLKLFVDTLFRIVEVTETDRVSQLPQILVRDASKIIDAVRGIDPQTRRCLQMVIAEFVKIAVKNVFLRPETEVVMKELPEDGTENILQSQL